MAKVPFTDYADELAYQRGVWEHKGSLRAVYETWYSQIVDELAPNRPVVEIGAGCGNFKAYFPEAVATDAIQVGDWIDRVVDARELPFEPGEVGNFVMIDVLHHLPRPLNFLREAATALQPGGRIVMLEPAATPWARAVLGAFHHEPVDLSQDLFAEDGTLEPENEGFTFANQAIGTLLFVRQPQETLRRLPEMRLVSAAHSDFVVYPATGGFSYLNLVPARAARTLHRFEQRLMRRFAGRTGMRLLIVLERDT
jgi:SAM-dependent methyltransferase